MGVLEAKILEYFQKNNGYKGFNFLKKHFKIKGENETNGFVQALSNLESQGLLYKNEFDEYILFSSKLGLYAGKITISKNGKGYVNLDEKKSYIITGENLNGIFNNDTVIIKPIDQKFATIKKVLVRDKNEAVYEVVDIDGKKNLSLYNNSNSNFSILNIDKLKNLFAGEIVLMDISDFNNPRLIKKIGHVNDPNIDVTAIAYNHGFEVDFNEKIMEELKNMPTMVSKAELINRTDLRDVSTFTIDGSDAKDIDDALSIKKLDNGQYELSVHIADVSHYVKLNSETFKRAYHNGTSSYLADFVIPMLHYILSNGICSLFPNQDRLTKTASIIIDHNGKIVDFNIFKSVINSKKKMTYEEVNTILENNIMVEGYEPYLNDLKSLEKLSTILNKAKLQRGYTKFNKGELKIKTSDDSFNVRTPGTAEEIVENSMLMANEAVGTFLNNLDVGAIFRIHEQPNEEKIEQIIGLLKSLGIGIKVPYNLASNYAVQSLLTQIEEHDRLGIFSELLLKSMKKAKYSDECLGHFGLALEYYVHFTAPIRRLADLVIHHLLDITLDGEIDKVDFNELSKFIKDAAVQASQRERAADNAERETNMMLMAAEMEKRIGEPVKAYVSNIGQFGAIVKTEDYFSAKISLGDMIDDYYYFDADKNQLIGRKTKNIYRIGDCLDCTVKEASKANRTINFIANGRYIEPKVKALKHPTI